MFLSPPKSPHCVCLNKKMKFGEVKCHCLFACDMDGLRFRTSLLKAGIVSIIPCKLAGDAESQGHPQAD